MVGLWGRQGAVDRGNRVMVSDPSDVLDLLFRFLNLASDVCCRSVIMTMIHETGRSKMKEDYSVQSKP